MFVMQYRTYKETMLPQMVRLWKEEAVRIRYKAYDSPEEWKADFWINRILTPRDVFWPLRIPAAWQGLQRQSARRNSCRDKNRDNTPGYIFLLVVKEEYEGRGVGSSLLEKAEAFLKGQGKHEIRISTNDPIKIVLVHRPGGP